jgi:hypothetical protein
MKRQTPAIPMSQAMWRSHSLSGTPSRPSPQWQDLQAERGRPILETLVTEALGEHANISP